MLAAGVPEFWRAVSFFRRIRSQIEPNNSSSTHPHTALYFRVIFQQKSLSVSFPRSMPSIPLRRRLSFSRSSMAATEGGEVEHSGPCKKSEGFQNLSYCVDREAVWAVLRCVPISRRFGLPNHKHQQSLPILIQMDSNTGLSSSEFPFGFLLNSATA